MDKETYNKLHEYEYNRALLIVLSSIEQMELPEAPNAVHCSLAGFDLFLV